MDDFLKFVLQRLDGTLVFGTGRRLLSPLSGGRVITRPTGVPFGWFTPIKRLPDGRIGVDDICVSLAALAFWLMSVIGLFALFHYLSVR